MSLNAVDDIYLSSDEYGHKGCGGRCRGRSQSNLQQHQSAKESASDLKMSATRKMLLRWSARE